MNKSLLRTITFFLLSLTILFTAACGASFQTGAAWDPEESKIFDDGVDLIDAPAKLQGQWAYMAQQELSKRTELADTIAVISLSSVQTDQNMNSVEKKHLQVHVQKKLLGSTPSSNFVLHSTKDSLGYTLLERHEDHLSGDFIVFIRWFEQTDGSRGHHFHLSPASPQMLKAVKALIKEREAL